MTRTSLWWCRGLLLALVMMMAPAAAFAGTPGTNGGGAQNAPSQTPTAIPPGWTKQEAIQWLLPKQQGTYKGQSIGGTAPGLEAYVEQHISFLAGHHDSCRDILGSIMECCKKTVPNQQKKWWQDYGKSQRQSAALNEEALVQHIKGSWSKIQGGATTFDLDAPLTSKYENVLGGGKGPSNKWGSGSLASMNKKFMAMEDKKVKPHLGWYCRDEDFQTAVKKDLGECHYLGSNCGTSVLGICLIKYEEYCCFNSPTSRIMREQYLKEGIGNMGTAKHPDCAGLTLADLQAGSLGNNDVSEIIGRMYEGGYLPKNLFKGDEWQLQYTGPDNYMGDPTRQTVSQRTLGTIKKMEPAAATSSIRNQAETLLPTATVQSPTGVGEVSFAAGYRSITSGKPLVVAVTRNGGDGMVSVTVTTVAGTAQPGTDYTSVNQTVYWGNGDVSQKTVTIPTTQFAGGGTKSFTVKISDPTVQGASGNVTLTPYTTMKVDLQPATD